MALFILLGMFFLFLSAITSATTHMTHGAANVFSGLLQTFFFLFLSFLCFAAVKVVNNESNRNRNF